MIAMTLKTSGAVNRFGRGVERAHLALARNGNAVADFLFGDTFFRAVVRTREKSRLEPRLG